MNADRKGAPGSMTRHKKNLHAEPAAKIDSAQVFDALIARLAQLQTELKQVWETLAPAFAGLNRFHRTSAQNLIHYLALRRHDLRQLQTDLTRHGISSLGRAEPFVMSNVEKVLKLLHRIVRRNYSSTDDGGRPLGFDESREILKYRTQTLFDAEPETRKVRIMVTLPSEAASNYELVRELLAAGMNCARINCAHDRPADWKKMVENLRRAEKELKLGCRICFDIAGPKLRTGPMQDGPRVLKWKPRRDSFGRLLAPAQIWLTPHDRPQPAPAGVVRLEFPAKFLEHVAAGDRIRFRDARGSTRKILVTEQIGESFLAEAEQTAYVEPATEFKLKGSAGHKKKHHANAVNIPPLEQYIAVDKGDTLILTADQTPGRPAGNDENGDILLPARIPCTLPEIFRDVRVGEPIWLDDGKIGGVIKNVGERELVVEITQTPLGGAKLRADKGINLPESDLSLASLTEKDLEDLRFVVEYADIVGYSFVRSGADVVDLQRKLKELDAAHLGIILKIETRKAFENLPSILLTAMDRPAVGVMIARGDLAVELGFERLSEVQEEILWMCEAAHMPVIWATQVLEQYSKEGVFSRAEITDAAMSERAECVMLNKGEFMVEAVGVLDDILRRMESHQDKKRAMMRRLQLAEKFFADLESHGLR